VKLAFSPLATALLAIAAVAGCGTAHDAGTAPVSAPAFDPQRTQDFVALTTAQAARRAQRIALVVARGSRVVEGAPGTPFTRTTFDVRSVLKGRLPKRFVLQVIGGRLGDRVVSSPVQPFASSHRYVLFLGPDGPAGPTIYPQAVLTVDHGAGAVLASIHRALRTTGGSR
jgi:hypothetical protein